MRERDASDRAGCTRRCRHRTHLALPFCGARATWMRLRLQRQRRLGPKLEVQGGARRDEAKEVAWHQNSASLCVSLSQCYLQCHTHTSPILLHTYVCIYVRAACMCVCVWRMCVGWASALKSPPLIRKFYPACLLVISKLRWQSLLLILCVRTHTLTHVYWLSGVRTHTYRGPHTYIDIPIHWQAPLGINRPKWVI